MDNPNIELVFDLIQKYKFESKSQLQENDWNDGVRCLT